MARRKTKRMKKTRAPVERRPRRKRKNREPEPVVNPTAAQPASPVSSSSYSEPAPAPVTAPAPAPTAAVPAQPEVTRIRAKTVRVAKGVDSSNDLITDAQLTVAKTKYSYGEIAYALMVKSGRGMRNLFDSVKGRAETLNIGKAKRKKIPETKAFENMLKTPADVDKWLAAECR
jgi:hypothetical protein